MLSSKDNFFERNAIWIIPVIAVILAVLGIVTSVKYLTDVFKDTGTIGDTIGGITAPIFNLLASVIIYYSFREQYRANELQKNSIQAEVFRTNALNEFNQVVALIEDLKGIEDDFEVSVPVGSAFSSSTISIKNTEAIKLFFRMKLEDDDLSGRLYPSVQFYTLLTHYFHLLTFICNKVNTFNYDDRKSKSVLQLKVILIVMAYEESFFHYYEKCNIGNNQYNDSVRKAFTEYTILKNDYNKHSVV